MPHLGFLPVRCVKWHHMHTCLLFMKCMLKQEDRTFYVPIIYLFFQINASETNSWHTVGSLSLQAGSHPRFCSLFSVYTAKTLYFPTDKGSLPPKPQFCTYRYHSTAFYLGTSFLALTESSCSFSWVTEMQDKRHRCWGADHKKFELSLIIFPGGNSSLACSSHCTSSSYFIFIIA